MDAAWAAALLREKGYADIRFVELNMDWTTPLRSQQADFIQRLKSGSLLHCETEGQHSELTVISGERLKQLRDFCWQMAEKYKRMSPVRDVFINNLKGKLGEEVVKARLSEFVTEVDYEKRLGGDGKVDFMLTSDPSIGIQVKARHCNIDTVRWSINSEEAEKNAVLICILIQEELSEAQAEYHLIMAGFIPTNIIQQKIKIGNNGTSVRIEDLLYGGGLRSYLKEISESGNCLHTLLGHSGSVNSVAISPNGKIIASGSEDKTIKIWNLNTGTLLRTLTEHSWSVYSIAISPDGQTLASGSGDTTIKLWNLNTGDLIHTIPSESNVDALAFSPDGQMLLSGSDHPSTCAFWDLRKGEFSEAPCIGVCSVAISPDGYTVVNGRADGIIQIRYLKEKHRTFLGHSSSVNSVAVSPDSQLVASGSNDKTIKIWNLCTGELLRILTGHVEPVKSVAISPDGQSLVSGSWDKTIKIWNIYTGKLLQTLFGHSGWVKSVAITPDGRILVSGSLDGTIKIWRLI